MEVQGTENTLTNGQAVRNFMYYCTNYDMAKFTYLDGDEPFTAPSAYSIFGTEGGSLGSHFAHKWLAKAIKCKCGTKAFYDMFYEMNSGYQEQMVDWISANYKGIIL